MAEHHRVSVAQLTLGNDMPLTLIAGPCVMESRQHALETAAALSEIAEKLGVGLIYKTSFDKANRTSLDGARGVGMKSALPIFAEIRETVGLPVITDVHASAQCGPVAEVVDVLQIPCVSVSTDRSADGSRRYRARYQREKGPVPCSVGYGECCGEDQAFGKRCRHGL